MNIQQHGTQRQDRSTCSSFLVWDLPGRGCVLTVEDTTTIQERHHHDYGLSDNRDKLQREKLVAVRRTIHIGEHCLPRMADVVINCITTTSSNMGTSSFLQGPQLIEIDFDGNQVVDCWQQETMVEIGFQGLPVIKSSYSLANNSRTCYDDVTRFFIALGQLGHAGVTEVVIKGLELDEWEGELLFGDYLARNCKECRDDDWSSASSSAFDPLAKPISSPLSRNYMESNNDATPVITLRACSLETPVIRMFQRLYPGSLLHHIETAALLPNQRIS
jgi:hypothetical protein